MSEIITVHLDQKPIYDIVIEKNFIKEEKKQ